MNISKQIKRAMKLKPLLGVDMCACGPTNQLKCEGVCRKMHTDKSGNVNCMELYHIDPKLTQVKVLKKEDDE